MKHIYSSICALLSGLFVATGANAQETTVIGATDCSTGYYKAEGAVVELKNNQSVTYKFINHNAGGTDNYKNCMVGVRTTEAPAAGNAEKLAVFRPDNWMWGWGEPVGQAAGVWKGPQDNPELFIRNTTGINWDNFVADINGAEVTAVVTYTNNRLTAKFSYKGQVTNNEITAEYGFLPANKLSYEKIYPFLFVEECYLEVKTAPVVTDITPEAEPEPEPEEPIDPSWTVIGATDCTTGFYGATSEPIALKNNQTVTYVFKNKGNGVKQWNNWLLGLRTDDKAQNIGSLLVLRADDWFWGWGELVGTDASNEKQTDKNVVPAELFSTTKNWGNSSTDWSTFNTNINGAEVTLVVTYKDKKVSMTATFTGVKNSVNYVYSATFNTELPYETIYTNLSVDASCLYIKSNKVEDTGAPTAIETVEAEVANVEYISLTGVKSATPARGMNIRVVTYADGSKKSSRVLCK